MTTKNDQRLILIVDDERIITMPLQRLVRKLLQKEQLDQYQIATENDPMKALGELGKRKKELALVVADIMMPQMNGLSFLSKVKELYPMAPRIVLTGFADKENAIRALNELDLFYYVEKPWDDDTFRQIILNALKQYRQERITTMFRRYVPYEVIEEYVDKSDDAIFEGKGLNATILFLDIVDFTRLTEKMNSQDVVRLLNEYLTAMVNVIHKRNGTLDKFTGDGLMALFGVPDADGKSVELAHNAVLAALDMVQSISKLNSRRTDLELEPLRVRIGLDSGQVIAGNVGSIERVNYTVVGNAVNTASRIEDVARHMIKEDELSCVLISHRTHQLVKDVVQGTIVFESQGPVELRGKKEKVSLYKVLSS